MSESQVIKAVRDLCCLSLAGATDVFLHGLVVPVTPTALVSRLVVSPAGVQTWNSVLLALFGIGLLVASPLGGFFADRCESRRWPYLTAFFLRWIGHGVAVRGK